MNTTRCCRTCCMAFQSGDGVICLSKVVQLFPDLETVQDVFTDCLPELQLDGNSNMALCTNCWNTIEKWCKFKRNCFSNAKAFPEHVQTFPAATIPNIPSTTNPLANTNCNNTNVSLPVNSQKKTNHNILASLLKEKIKQVISTDSVKPKKILLEDIPVRPVTQAYFRKNRIKRESDEDMVESFDDVCNQDSENQKEMQVKTEILAAIEDIHVKTEIPAIIEEISEENKDIQDYYPAEVPPPAQAIKNEALGNITTRLMECPLCQNFYYGYSKLLVHCKEQHGNPRLYMCVECHKTFLNEEDIKKHMSTHNKKKAQLENVSCLTCDVCLKIFLNEEEFKTHSETHMTIEKYEAADAETTEVWYSCSMCEECFKETDQIGPHMAEKHADVLSKLYRCNICNAAFKSSVVFRTHCNEEHKGAKYKCTECGVLYRRSSSFEEHLKRHKSYKCPNCDKSFNLNRKLTSHLRSCKQFHCEICNEKFMRRHILNKHMRQSHNISRRKAPTSTRKLICSVCGMTVLAAQLSSHMQRHNPTRQLQVCEFCGISFKCKSNLKLHLRKHTGEGIYLCEVCGAKLLCTAEYTNHMKRHTGEKPFKCLQCGQAYFSKQSLKKHINWRHDKVRRYQCNDCLKLFLDRAALQRHILIHTGERPYQCNICGARFTQSNSVKQHRKQVHGQSDHCPIIRVKKSQEPNSVENSQEPTSVRRTRVKRPPKTYTCDQCGRVFLLKPQYEAHVIAHTGIRAYHCKQCPAKFFTEVHLKRHHVVHVTEYNYKCDLCEKKFKCDTQLRLHKKRHEGKRPFSEQMSNCSVCNRRIRNSKMKKHLLEHEETKNEVEGIKSEPVS